MKLELIDRLNTLGSEKTPFLLILSFCGERYHLWPLRDLPSDLEITFPSFKTSDPVAGSAPRLVAHPPSYNTYLEGFNHIQHHLKRGDSYLINYTLPSPIETDICPKELFSMAHAKYRLRLPNHFFFFSPEPFIKIENNSIHTYPMKGTIDASIEDAEKKILADPKEQAELATITDLLRNDLSRFSKNVTVPRFRYVEHLHTSKKDLLQVSSHIRGDLESGWQRYLGDMLNNLLPAGSISGAPKKATCQIIAEAEKYDRGFYTGITLLFTGEEVESCVNIRFIKETTDGLIYHSGGGITHRSDPEEEYRELISKIYIPTAVSRR